MTNWKAELETVARKTKAKVQGLQRIEHAQHGLLVTTALHAFGDDSRATFFIEGLPPNGGIPRPDLILLHPDIGVLVIENKGVALADIHSVQTTGLTLVRDGKLKDEDPFHQAERVMYRLKDLCKLRFDPRQALFLRTAALPRIRRGEFEMRFKCQWPTEALFTDACTVPQVFREQVLAYSDAGQCTARKSTKLSKRAHDGIMTILSGKGLFYAPRPTHVEAEDKTLLGVQIQEMELALKEATQQQKDLGKSDLRGAHRMFRGVAGSGKSIMLALSVAQTLVAFKDEQQGLFGAQQPSHRVLVVCFNKSLVHYLRSKIEDRYGRIAWEAPNDQNLTVTHFEGLVREIEGKHPTLATGMTFEQKEERAKALSKALDQLDAAARESLLFDAVYVDEAQDLLPAEFEFLRRLARTDGKGQQTLILFYDNAQNIYGVTPPTWEKLGINVVGRTVFLDQCLRNTTETLAFAFNVLVGSFAPEGQKVATRQFADVGSLKQRGLISENGDRYDIHFSPRMGPPPVVLGYPHRNAEVECVVETIRRLIHEQKVLPNDILVLYKSHYSFKGKLEEKLKAVLGSAHRLRLVDSDHDFNKNLPLIEDGVLTVSTIASAKGYDAPVVFLLGTDELGVDPQGRASFYVGATRAKLCLYVSGVKTATPGLLEEILLTAEALAKKVTPAQVSEKIVVKMAETPVAKADEVPLKAKPVCRHCGSERLNAQHGRYGYFFRCIDCTENTPIDMTCPKCGKKGRIRKDKYEFFRECTACNHSELAHKNVPLLSLEA